MTSARDPEHCEDCGTKSKVLESRNEGLGYRRRRHECPTCGLRWTSKQTRGDETATDSGSTGNEIHR